MESARYTPIEKWNPSTVSKIFYCWVFSYLINGRKKDLQLSDIHPVLDHNSAETIAKRVTAFWSQELNKSTPQLTNCLIATFLPNFSYITFLEIMKDCVFRVVQGPALGVLITALSSTEQFGFKYGIYAGVGLVVALLLFTIFHHYSIFLLYELGMKVRVALTMLIYDKTLRLSQFSLGETNGGQIINLLTNDANRFERGLLFAPYLIVAPLQIVSVTGVLWIYLGYSCLALPFFLLLLVPLQSWVGTKFGEFRVAAAKATDNRVRLINEAINGIQVIKMCAYENVYFQKICKARKAELKVITRTWMFDALNKSVFDVSSKLMVMLTLLIYILVPNSVVNATTIFITLTLANYLRNTITNFLPMAITSIFELRVSIDRIETFLLKEEIENFPSTENSTQEHEISVTDFTGRWTKASPPVISNVSTAVQHGQLTAVIGSVASGKTSLIHGILGELLAETGTVNVAGSVSYAPQDPWIFSGTIRENILAGEKFEQEWYTKVVDACSLAQDIDMFPEADQASVGEKGMALSGGQKARVNLARAVYRKADIYLLDDPLSAVDVKVCKRLYENCICGLLQSKTVVLVTHHLKLLSSNETDQIVVLKEGRVVGSGPFAEVKQHLDWEVKSDFDIDQQEEEVVKTDTKSDPAAVIASVVKKSGVEHDNTTHNQELSGKNETQNLSTTNEIKENDRFFYLGIYGAIIAGIFVASLLRNLTLVVWTMSSSSKLHNNLFVSLVRAPMSFFEKNSIGRVLNRIVNDIGNIDDHLPRIYNAVVNNVFQICGTLFVVCYLQPLMVLPALILLVLFIFLRNFFLSTASDIKRIESVARSPVLAHVGTTIAGLTVIRALKSQDFHRKQFIQKQDIHSSALYLNFGSYSWFAFATDWLSTAYFIVLVISYWLTLTDDGSSLGLAISNALMLTVIFLFGVSQLTMLDNQLITVERVLEYVDIRSEGRLLTPDSKKVTWGDKGKIEISAAKIAYGEKIVLRDVSLKINAGERIGIVGRTGCGKSTLVNGLYRLVNLQSGHIKIDDIDVSTVGLHNLRRRLTIMPQVPQLFTGTVRYNLDPLESKSDDELYQALGDVKLLDRLDKNLYADVAQGVTNYSTGERQLLCLARAILSRTKILVLDEATASLDAETESIIQTAINKNFGDSTIITIAHRLDTIIKCDRVLVLDAGIAAEFGEPHVLLQNESGIFYDLVHQAKGSGAEYLCRLAEEAYNARHT